MPNKLRAAFLGAGSMSRLHAANLLKLTDVQITAICSNHQETAASMAADLNLACTLFTDFDQMLAEANFEILFICIPPFAHKGQFEAAVNQGKHVFIEKPIALDRQRAASMLAAAQQVDVITQVGYHLRFGQAVQKLYQMIQSGAAGRPVLFDGRYDCNALHGPWWRDKNKSGGQVFEQAIHLYDLSIHLLGAPATINARTVNLCHQDVPGYTVGDNSAALITYTSGALASLCASNCAIPGQWRDTYTVICEKITANFTSANEAEFIYTGESGIRRETIRAETNLYQAELTALIAAIRGEGPALCPVSEGYKSLSLVAAVMDSAHQQGETITLA